MSIEATISRAGKTCTWRKMLGTGGVYDTATGAVTAPTFTTTTIKMVLDGFGSVESQLRAFAFGTKSLLQEGQLRAFTVANLRPGDIVAIDGEDYTVIYCKSIWKKEKVVCNEALVQL
jgi:hypothetical protein